MSNNDQIYSAGSQRAVQDQSGSRSLKGPQNNCPAQQRVWHPCSADHRLETTGTRRYAQPVRVGSGLATVNTRRTRAYRRASVPTDWTVEGRERLAQKKIANELGSDLDHLVEPAHTQLSISQQCTLLSIPRSSYYYQPVGESVQNLALMERIDKLFMARPEMGVRRMHQELTTEDEPLNIKRIRRLMRLMGLEAVGPKPNLSRPQPGHTVYPYLLLSLIHI